MPQQTTETKNVTQPLCLHRGFIEVEGLKFVALGVSIEFANKNAKEKISFDPLVIDEKWIERERIKLGWLMKFVNYLKKIIDKLQYEKLGITRKDVLVKIIPMTPNFKEEEINGIVEMILKKVTEKWECPTIAVFYDNNFVVKYRHPESLFNEKTFKCDRNDETLIKKLSDSVIMKTMWNQLC